MEFRENTQVQCWAVKILKISLNYSCIQWVVRECYLYIMVIIFRKIIMSFLSAQTRILCKLWATRLKVKWLPEKLVSIWFLVLTELWRSVSCFMIMNNKKWFICYIFMVTTHFTHCILCYQDDEEAIQHAKEIGKNKSQEFPKSTISCQYFTNSSAKPSFSIN